jgi:hypothetical protein
MLSMTDEPEKPKGKARRRRVDSAAGITEAIVAGGKVIVPPADMDLTDRERAAFDEVIDEQSKSELSPHKIRLSALLAIDIAALEQEKLSLRREGAVLVNSHGNSVANPRTKVIQNLTMAILAQRRSMAIHTRALEGTNQRAALRRSHNKTSEAFRTALEDDDLIPLPGGEHDPETKH